MPYKFTGKERDTESNLDYFGARYFSSSLGRFMSPDAKSGSAKRLEYPQDSNLYSYTVDNPLRYFDPDGRDWQTAWQDFKTLGRSVYAKISVGVGFSVGAKVGAIEARAGVSVTDDIQAPPNEVLEISRTTEVGVHLGVAHGPGIGKSETAEKPLVTVHRDYSVTGPEDAHLETTDSFGSDVSLKSSGDKFGLGVEAGFGAQAGGEIGITREGLDAFKDLFKQIKNEIILPALPIPSVQTPSPPPTDPSS